MDHWSGWQIPVTFCIPSGPVLLLSAAWPSKRVHSSSWLPVEEATKGWPSQGQIHEACQQDAPSEHSSSARGRCFSLKVGLKQNNLIKPWFKCLNVFSTQEPGQLFSESYFNVAVMFASLPNYIAFFSELDDKKPLTILHEIISKFDQVRSRVLQDCTIYFGGRYTYEYIVSLISYLI